LAHSFHTLAELIGFASLASWIYLAFFRGQFWQIRESRRDPGPSTNHAPDIIVLIPARNEATCIGNSLTSLLTQRYPGSIRVVVIDDNSSDATAEVARSAASAIQASERLQVVSASSPPPGWTGKLWALSEGVRRLEPVAPDYLLLTDADIVHAPDNIAELVAKAQADNFDLVSLMVKLRCESGAERAFIPAFLFFFLMLYPPAWVANSRRRTAAAAGGCMLIRARMLAAIGGIAAIRGELIDDCALAKRVKKNGGRVYLGITSRTQSVRAYPRMRDVEQMIARTAFTQLHHSTGLLAGTVVSMMIVFIAPPLLLFSSTPASWMGAASWLLMCICFLPSLRLYKLSTLRALTLPALALFYVTATVHSAVLYARGQGGIWKGRVQDSLST
jgi:hopene-associated glycosyltransferase HpnB